MVQRVGAAARPQPAAPVTQMSYGAKTWAKRAGRARSAGKRKKSSTRRAKPRRASSAPRAKKKRTRKAKASTNTRARSRRSVSKKRATKAVAFYDLNTGKKVAVAKADYQDAYADPELTTKKPRMVYRYNPDTGRKQRVADTSEEAETWSAKKPPKGVGGILVRGYQKGGAAGAALVTTKVTEKVLRSGSRRINAAVKSLTKKGLAAAGLTTGTAASIVAAGLIAYGLGSEAFYPQRTDALKLDAALRNYLALKKSLPAKLGRPLTRDELRAIYAKYVETVVKIKAHDPMINQRPGRE
jgi:hypothetical protein